MPDIPVSSPLGYIGVFALFVGFILVLAGLRIFRVEKVTIAPGPKTCGIGIFLIVLGIGLLLPDIVASFSRLFSTPAPTAAMVEAAPTATGILPSDTLDERPDTTTETTVTPAIVPTPTSFPVTVVADLPPQFSPPTFCTRAEFDFQNSRCKVSRQTFTHSVTSVYVSWTCQGAYEGMEFSRKWYRDGELILEKHDEWDGVGWGTGGDSEYTYVENRHGFEVGLYRLDLYINGQLVQQGNFSVR